MKLLLTSVNNNSSNSSGPGLEDFVTGQVEEATFRDYQGKLKREAGDKRLRLPPWLKGKLVIKIICDLNTTICLTRYLSHLNVFQY